MHKLIFPDLLRFSGPAVTTEAQSFELKDGGRITVKPDGTPVRTDAAGNPVALGDGMVMEAKDGTQLMMKDGALWKRVASKRRPDIKP